jgi:Retrotransposon gag protein
MHQVPPLYKPKLATLQFYGIASEWYDCYLIDHESSDRSQLVRLIRKRFQSTDFKNGMEELMELYQTGSMTEYIEKFERLRARILLENRLFSEADFIDAFIGDSNQISRLLLRCLNLKI